MTAASVSKGPAGTGVRRRLRAVPDAVLPAERNDGDVDRKIAEFRRLKSIAEQAAERAAVAERDAIDAMMMAGITKSPGYGTLVTASRLVIDFDKLGDAVQRQLPPVVWRNITATTIDREKLEAAILQNPELARLVRRYSEEKPNKPYIKVG